MLLVDTYGIEGLYDYIEERTGIALKKSKVMVQNNIVALCIKNKIPSFNDMLIEIENNEVLFRSLIDVVTVNETYFFREKGQIENAIKRYKNNKDSISILSVPCSSGEEAYSIAIIALESGITNFNIVGVDISTTVINKAKNASYGRRSVGLIPQEILKRYFIVDSHQFIVKKEVTKHVEFVESNVFEETFLHIGRFDLIFSRNMFIYFKDEKKVEAYKRLEKLKKDNSSSIFLGHADISSKLGDYIRSQN